MPPKKIKSKSPKKDKSTKTDKSKVTKAPKPSKPKETKSKERYEEEKAIFWKYTEVFGQSRTEQYKEYFSR